MIIGVSGGRNYSDKQFLFSTLDRLERESGVNVNGLIHGAASGADTLACEWQRERIKHGREQARLNRLRDPHRLLGLPRNCNLWIMSVPAMWRDLETPPVVIRKRRDGTLYNAAAGGIRNQKMIDLKPGLWVLFPGSSGTADAKRRVIAAGIPYVEARR